MKIRWTQFFVSLYLESSLVLDHSTLVKSAQNLKILPNNINICIFDINPFQSNVFLTLTHFSPMPHFYTPYKRQKTYGFLTFSRGIEMLYRTKMG